MTDKLNDIINNAKDKVSEIKGLKKEVKTKKKTKKSTIIDLYKEDFSVKDIIEKTGYNYTTVYGCINDHKIKTLFNNGESISPCIIEEKYKKN